MPKAASASSTRFAGCRRVFSRSMVVSMRPRVAAISRSICSGVLRPRSSRSTNAGSAGWEGSPAMRLTWMLSAGEDVWSNSGVALGPS